MQKKVSYKDKKCLIEAHKELGEDNVEEVIRYFVVHNYVVNGDSYTGSMIHNYFLYEEDSKLSMNNRINNIAFGGFNNKTKGSDTNFNPGNFTRPDKPQ